ncbi:MAG: hypothetical protein ACNI3A_06440 [Desulfovibrio sp.]|uniref:hypothetical protein n=1 Tax=Desulfovibrio sp. 7SRBS1 TaxID=3378064 RepID=UPI003B3C597B
MSRIISPLYCDAKDEQLLDMVNQVLSRTAPGKFDDSMEALLTPFMHPRGIKELSTSTGLRIAFAIINLLGSLESGQSDIRLRALRALRDETLALPVTSMRINTARVLVQIMKELVRSRYDYISQLKLAHDFRRAASGKPSIVLEQLEKYHLLEMPEDNSQIAFDDHVHDASTVGRKTPTHLVMDAWVKGIRILTVIHWGFVSKAMAEELLEAAEIMGIKARIGIRLNANLGDKYATLIWVPSGFDSPADYLAFLEQPVIKEFLDGYREVNVFRRHCTQDILTRFNAVHRPVLEEKFGLRLQQLKTKDFLEFVGEAQPSPLHLARFILNNLRQPMQARTVQLRKEYEKADAAQKEEIESLVETMNNLTVDSILAHYLTKTECPDNQDPNIPCSNAPAILKLTPEELLYRLRHLHSGFRITLVPFNLKTEEVIDILFQGKGAITHIELANLRQGAADHPRMNRLSRLKDALNHGNVVIIKRMIRDCITRMKFSDAPAGNTTPERLHHILRNLSDLTTPYSHNRLKVRMGSGSSGYAMRNYGMGLTVVDSLPARQQRNLTHSKERFLPFRVDPKLRTSVIVQDIKFRPPFTGLVRFIPPSIRRFFFAKRQRRWKPGHIEPAGESNRNLMVLGGRQLQDNELSLRPPERDTDAFKFGPSYFNTALRNWLKVFIGFVPAFLTFALTKDWWLLAYFGAPIWFGITGLRNIIQSILGGGGLRRSPLLHWGDLISWQRIADSLLFTGFSVPLLDWLVKTIILDHGMNITTQTDPLMLYSYMALANGIYISSHNLFRGLPKSAAAGNFFRSILSIPIAVAFNGIIGSLLSSMGVVGVDGILQRWAAVISKLASDCVAGVIEGLADRATNLRLRTQDYEEKVRQMMDTLCRLEMLFPDDDIPELLASPERFQELVQKTRPDLFSIVVINALDLLYFWLYQPRAPLALRETMEKMSPDEQDFFINSQQILTLERTITTMFVDGLYGKQFAKPLSFYLERYAGYLRRLKHLRRLENRPTE